MASQVKKSFVLTEDGYKAIVGKQESSVATVWSSECASGSWTNFDVPTGTRALTISSAQTLLVSTNKAPSATFLLPANTPLTYDKLYVPGGEEKVTLMFKTSGSPSGTVGVLLWIDSEMLVASQT